MKALAALKDTTRTAILSALIEAGFVVFGVILALAANEWRQSIADREAGRVALESIVEELEQNAAALDRSLEYHDLLMAMISQSLKDERALRAEDFPRGFLSAATTFRTAWQMAGQTGALAEVPYDARLALSRLYAQQERYESQAEFNGGMIYQALFEGGSEAVISRPVPLLTALASIAYRERELVESYRGVLESFGPSGQP